MLRRRCSIVVLASLLSVGLDAPCGASEPQVAFAVKNGWVEFAVRQDGQPVAEAAIQVIDETGKNFADGQTGPDGESAFPLPKGAWFTVEIKTGARTADPIRLFRTPSGVAPERVLLSYGLRPCCRLLKQNDVTKVDLPQETPAPASDDATSRWLPLAVLPAGLIVAVVLVATIRLVRRPGRLSE